jgi:hypothetical protein
MAIIKVSRQLMLQLLKMSDAHQMEKRFKRHDSRPVMLQELQRALLLPARITEITFPRRMEIAELKTSLDGFADLEKAMPKYERGPGGGLLLKEVARVE